MKLKDILKVAAPVVLGPAVGGMFPGTPILSSALASGIGASLFGQKPKDALRAAVLGGLGGAMFGGPQQTATQSRLDNFTDVLDSKKVGQSRQITPPAGTGTAKGIGSVIGRGVAPGAEAKTMSGELLKSLKFAGSQDEGNLLFRLLNTNLGEGLAAGLVAQLLAGGDEEDGPAPGSYERRPFGAGGPGGQLGGINYMKAGGEPDFFPRRTGGIDPAEGSGTKDDVPALLLAGEFVHTRDANEGLGKMMGAKNKDEAARMGIEAQYQLMDAFERMA